ncbi:hypothetical protein BC629DRAFT_1594890 [Irpex lacteus]|nr:hypothetical protein BC629DRAFT_1594890 [Irpex lacteus]
MPALQSGKVLVSGANGYIAVWVVKKLLEDGFAVRGTVRSEKSIPYLQQLFSSYGDKVEFVIVPDITLPGAFDDAVKDVDAIAHTASPFHFNVSHPKELIEPAVLGTTGILESALKHGKNVKRIIILSSCAAVMEADGYPEPVVLTEKDWNVRAAANCEKLGKDASLVDAYFASKTLAERAAWDFAAKHKGEASFDIVAWIRLDHGLTSVTSHEHMFSPYRKRQLAERNHCRCWTLYMAAMGTRRSSDRQRLPAGISGYDLNDIKYPIKHANNKSRELLGIDYIDIPQSTKDILAQFKERGWY